MVGSTSLLKQEKWRIIDQSTTGLHVSALTSFGMDDTLCSSVGSGMAPATARTWVHDRTIVLGIQDTRLPHLKEALTFLKEQGYHYIVRNSGGLAVVLDKDVLNISLILPEQEKRIDINSGYDTMFELIKYMFRDYGKTIEAKEIVGSYCPGSYDLSIDGKKFAGISQRRLRSGVAVQIYLCVNGSGQDRAGIIKQFYSYGLQGETTKFEYPEINPEVMASLAELLGVSLTVDQVMTKLLLALKDHAEFLFADQLQGEELSLFESYYDRVVERNDKIMQPFR
ncbi:biotin/lipoate A/B protein ligase family protein [Niallia circulans]|uniref:lipoate--protein ligase family protein n=1 Tax=Niallia circulans TaxID=1397 RepID=UPI00077C6774|nr:biotin/lipoate A/B protein ligase family protein [Niallia circulans]MDR4316892.1 lipoate--protein ligase family protein [Niallia circulans]MED3840112.1 biotin/lipoate A/B protein ligase family protein [Niallia circulans]MED4241800.1 biotin/lipoate A/B protein ligase family protein [Niallia circulans]MED4250250.1 biotin/lipoate A/B protein ligase family protein [Niallia circulans]QKH64034.1 lipoate--protein ligase family protein [Niallia circulans]